MFKKLVVTGMVACFALSPVAEARVQGAQEESGMVILPTPHPQDPNVCFQGVGRRINMATQGAVSGPFGAIFDIDEATWGGKFKLTGSGATGTEDVDLYFFGTFGDIAADPTMNSPTIFATYQERNTEGEVGTVPPESTKAIVCLYTGLAVNWEYSASPPKKKKK